MEVHHAILYEGWETNGKRISLHQPTVIMTTEPIQTFWDEAQAVAANTYSFEKARVITKFRNSLELFNLNDHKRVCV